MLQLSNKLYEGVDRASGGLCGSFVNRHEEKLVEALFMRAVFPMQARHPLRRTARSVHPC